MNSADSSAFVKQARDAATLPKREFIADRVAGRDVLDLGFVAHSIDECLKHPETWLHEAIRERASSVLGVDLLRDEVSELKRLGYDAVIGDALSLRLDRRFGAVVCGDLIEHVGDPEALLRTVSHHLGEDGLALITTPNPFAATRFFNILAEGSTSINVEHTCWFCPQTMFQLVGRTDLYIDEFYWLVTDFSGRTTHRLWGPPLNALAGLLARHNGLFRTDFGVVLRRRSARG